MIRQGKYTKPLTISQRVKRFGRRYLRWFKKLSKPKKFFVITGPIIAFLVITPLATYAYFARDIGNQERLMNRNNTGIVLTDKNGEVFYSTGRAEHRTLLELKDIDDDIEHALIAAEDKNFYEHSGFSVGSILAALYANFATGKAAYGGSTLTQQLAKNTVLTSDRNFLRKYQELSIAIAIEQTYTKDQILSMYLNSVYYGEGAFGIEDAAQTYFNKSPADLTLAESAMLIGVLPSPTNYSPVNGNPEYAKERQTTVLTRMVDNGNITEEEKEAALAEEITYAKVQGVNDNVAPHFTQMVINELYEEYGEERVTRSGYQVETTIDLGLQKDMNDNIKNHLPYIEARGGTNAGGVAIDPNSGEVRALVGSADWNSEIFGKVNMATTPRQPGSSFKPIYYAEALADGVITPATILADVPTNFGGYQPQNANLGFSGNISVRNALARSLNIPSVKVMEKMGVQNAIEAAKKVGITTIDTDKNYGLSLALGSAEVSLLEMTHAYTAYANDGNQFDTIIVRKINDKFDDTIFTATHAQDQAISSGGAYLISSILSDNNARAPLFGSSLTVPGHTAAVKTGTTDDARDAWTIGYTPQIVIGVWVGNNDNAAMRSGGSDMAGPIWVNTMSDALAGSRNIEFSVPDDVVQRATCRSNGGLANINVLGNGVYGEYFLATALPSASCIVDVEDDKDDRSNKDEEDKDNEKPDKEDPGNETADPPKDDTPPLDDGTTPPDDGTSPGGEPDPGDGEENPTLPSSTTPTSSP